LYYTLYIANNNIEFNMLNLHSSDRLYILLTIPSLVSASHIIYMTCLILLTTQIYTFEAIHFWDVNTVLWFLVEENARNNWIRNTIIIEFLIEENARNNLIRNKMDFLKLTLSNIIVFFVICYKILWCSRNNIKYLIRPTMYMKKVYQVQWT